MLLTKLKAFGGLIKVVLVFIVTLGIYRAGKKSEQLDQAEANNEAQRELTKASAEGNEQYQEKVNEARNTNAHAGRFTE